MKTNRTMRRTWAWLLAVVVAAGVFTLPACEQGGHFTLLGYSSQPNYNREIKTVRVPIFKNQSMSRGIEFDLTQAVIREIELKTPYRVVSAGGAADTELLGNIMNRAKTIVNFNQLGEVRDSETILTVEIIWRDLRAGHTGDVLSLPPQQLPGQTPLPAPKPGAQPAPVLVQASATFQPELGGSLTTALNKDVNKLAEQIVSMMEKPW